MVSMPLADTSPFDWPRKWQAALGSWTTLTPNLFSHINVFLFERVINDSSCDSATIALSLVAFTELLLSEFALQFVVCQILPRKRQPFDGYNDRVSQVNTLVREALQGISRTKFLNQRGLINPTTNI